MAKENKDKAKKNAGAGGPELTVGLGRGFKLLLLFLFPVVLLASWCLVTWHGGPELRHPMTGERWQYLAQAVGGAGLMACAFWLVLPLAHWFRLYPVHRFKSGSAAAWFLPMYLALPIWVGLYVLALATVAAGGWAAWNGLIHLGLLGPDYLLPPPGNGWKRIAF